MQHVIQSFENEVINTLKLDFDLGGHMAHV